MGTYASNVNRSAGRSRGVPEVMTITVAALVAACVFFVDTFTAIEGAVAVFYVLVMMMASEMLSRRGVLIVAAACGALSVISFLASHGLRAELPAYMRLAVSFLALAITTMLIFKNRSAHCALVRLHDATFRNEYRYRTIFQQSRVALLEQDYSPLKRLLDAQKAGGMADVSALARLAPMFLRQCAAMVQTVAANDAALELLGVQTPEEASGSLARFIPGDAAWFSSIVKAVYEGERRVEVKARLQNARGEELVAIVTLEFPQDETHLDRVVVGLLDFTQREKVQNELMMAQGELAKDSRAATMGVFAASLAHELSQPLAALVVNAEACQRWLSGPNPDFESAARCASRMISDGERANEIVKNVRALFHRGPTSAGTYDAYKAAVDACAIMKHELESAGVDTVIEDMGGVHLTVGASGELKQVLVNLIRNSIQAMKEAGTRSPSLKLAIQTTDDTVLVRVHDNGTGIADDRRDKIFEPFFTTKTDGMGMGLAICRSSIESRGGSLTLGQSTGTGAVFEISLPPAQVCETNRVRPKPRYDRRKRQDAIVSAETR